MQDVVDRMAAGVLCLEGFLGADRRTLEEVLDADAADAAALGLAHERIADRLADILDGAVAALGVPVEVAPGVVALWREAMGRIASPWPGEGTFPKGEVELTGPPADKEVRFTALSIHLIRRHGFYQGRGTRYRLEPERLARLLAL